MECSGYACIKHPQLDDWITKFNISMGCVNQVFETLILASYTFSRINVVPGAWLLFVSGAYTYM